MQSEIVICKTCHQEKELYYDEDDTVVSETPCSCEKKLRRINLDEALRQLKLSGAFDVKLR
jgi:hypothetical protein